MIRQKSINFWEWSWAGEVDLRRQHASWARFPALLARGCTLAASLRPAPCARAAKQRSTAPGGRDRMTGSAARPSMLPSMPLGPSAPLTASRARRELLAAMRVARPAVPRPVARPPNTLGVSPKWPGRALARGADSDSEGGCSQGVVGAGRRAEQQQQPGALRSGR